MEKPLVSVMMPVYNGLPLIKASLESLYRQTWTNWECLIVDDGSSDGTSAYLDSISDPRVKVFHFPKNQGRSAARQKALDEAKGKYLAMLDADDLYHPQKLEIQVKEMEANPSVVLVSCPMISFGIETQTLVKRGCNLGEGEHEFTGLNFPVHASSMLITSVAKCHRYDTSLNFGEDQDFLKKCLQGMSFRMLSQPLYYYSEFNSVTKSKILKSYKNRFTHYYKKGQVKAFGVVMTKYLVSILTFPFVSLESILKRRGIEPSKQEIEQFKLYIRPLAERYLNQELEK